MNDKAKGLYKKFDVRRTDGSSDPGGKHHDCEYFVLDMTHDKHARAALTAYALSCSGEYPLLADDLFRKCESMPRTMPRIIGVTDAGRVIHSWHPMTTPQGLSNIEHPMQHAAPDSPEVEAAMNHSAIGEMREGGVVWFGPNPHAFPVGTLFYAGREPSSVERAIAASICVTAEQVAADLSAAKYPSHGEPGALENGEPE